MRNPKTSFDLNIQSVRELHALHNTFQATLPALDLSDILRAELVLVVSALDCYIHDIVRTQMSAILAKSAPVEELPSGFKTYSIPIVAMQQYMHAITDEEKEAIINKALKDTLYKFSFESSNTIDCAMNYIGVKSLWTKIKPSLGEETIDIKKHLDIIIRRRNNIAHQSDISSLATMEKDAISREDIDDVLNFITKLVNAMDIEIHNQIH